MGFNKLIDCESVLPGTAPGFLLARRGIGANQHLASRLV